MKKGFMGYSKKSVDKELCRVREEYDDIIREKSKRITFLRDESLQLKQLLSVYKKQEESLISAVVRMEKLLQDTQKQAQQTAEKIIDNAIHDAKIIKKQAKENTIQLEREYELKKRNMLDVIKKAHTLSSQYEKELLSLAQQD